MWKQGVLWVMGGVFHYWIKVYKRRSQFGIEGGKISKLMIKQGGEIVANYDRGWDIEPTAPDAKLALEILLHSENY